MNIDTHTGIRSYKEKVFGVMAMSGNGTEFLLGIGRLFPVIYGQVSKKVDRTDLRKKIIATKWNQVPHKVLTTDPNLLPGLSWPSLKLNTTPKFSKTHFVKCECEIQFLFQYSF